jgi:hypothetical protein
VTAGTTGTSTQGFLVIGSNFGGLGPSGGGRGSIYIYNTLGELVWIYETSLSTASSPRMAYDGRSMLALELNVPTHLTNGAAYEVSMDGSGGTALTVHANAHHDLAASPDGGFYYIVRDTSGSCDAVYKYPGNTLVYDLADALPTEDPSGGGDVCHANQIHYNHDDASVTVSLLNLNAFVTVGTDGTLKWVLGSSDSTFDLGSFSWTGNFGFHWANDTTFAFWENGGNASLGHVFTLDFANNEVDADKTYDPGSQSTLFGDIQVLPGGNILTTASQAGSVREMTPSGETVQEMNIPTGSGIGQLTFRETLYGAPPR